MGISIGNGKGMGMTINFLGNGNGNGNCNMGMGGNGIQKSIPADLYCTGALVQTLIVDDRGRLSIAKIGGPNAEEIWETGVPQRGPGA